MSEEIKNEFICVLKDTGLKVLWKTNEIDIVEDNNNNSEFMFAKWLPQEKVLGELAIYLFSKIPKTNT